MLLKNIKLYNFRNYSSLDLNLQPRLNLFIGENGQGKTNLLESIYLSSTFRSFRTSDVRHMVGGASNEFKVSSLLWDGEQEHDLVLKWDGQKKAIFFDGKKPKSQKRLKKDNFSVFFSNKDLYFVHDHPATRRQFFDQLLSMLNKNYRESLKDYQIYLKLRNSLLKQGRPFQQYDEALAKNGLILTNARLNFLESIREKFQSIFKELLKQNYLGDLKYLPIKGKQPLTQPMSLEVYHKWMESCLSKDKQSQRTSFGPHQGDFMFYLNNALLRDFGSQGQVKLFVYALKLTITQYYEKALKRFPTLLLDDVFADLDENRISYFMEFISRANQVFVTCPNKNLVQSHIQAMSVFKINQGKVSYA